LNENKVFYRKNLPHWQPENAIFFVTTRLEGSIAGIPGGPAWLAIPQVAKIVREALIYRDQTVYNLFAFCIMSTHKHIVFSPLKNEQGQDYRVFRIMQSLKRYTARKANIFLKRRGAFWKTESFDHVIRSENSLKKIIHYVLQNPVKAGLVGHWKDWPWSYCRPDLEHLFLD